MSFVIADCFSAAGGGQNGVPVLAYKASRFGGVPAEDASPPGGGSDAGPVDTGASFGGDGFFQITTPTCEDYYLSFSYNGHTYWKLYPTGGEAGQGAGPFASGASYLPLAGGTLTGALVQNLVGKVAQTATPQVDTATGTAKLYEVFNGSFFKLYMLIFAASYNGAGHTFTFTTPWTADIPGYLTSPALTGITPTVTKTTIVLPAGPIPNGFILLGPGA